MTTYQFTVHFKKAGILDWDTVRATDKVDACRKISELHGDVSIVDVARTEN